jgi:hypothetical protein
MIGLLAALTFVGYPYPPTPPTESTEPPEVESGECVLVGANFTTDEPTLIIRCGISDEVDRLFEFPLTEADLFVLDQLLDLVEDVGDDDEVTVH